MPDINLIQVLRQIATDYLAKGKIKPTDFVGSVEHIVTDKDKLYSNKDPFHSQEMDEQRIHKGGHIKSGSKMAHVLIPDFFNALSLRLPNTKGGLSWEEINSLTLLKVDVTDVENIRTGDGVIIAFKDPGKYEQPYVSKRISSKNVLEYRVRIPKEKNKLSNKGKSKSKEDCSYSDFAKNYFQKVGESLKGDFKMQVSEQGDDFVSTGTEAKETAMREYENFKKKYWK